MKVIRTETHLRMVGKAWEIKHKLREFSASHMTLKEYLGLFSE